MPELDPETRELLQGLCRQITVAHELDPEIQEELYGHMEDKLLAYLSGEERLSEADALVLVREHFGDAGVLKELFQDAHASAVRMTLARRVLVAGFTFTTWMFIATVIDRVLQVALLSDRLQNFDPGSSSHPTRWYNAYATLLLYCGATAALWIVLEMWRRRAEEYRPTWFAHRGLAFVAGALLLVFTFWLLTPIVSFPPSELAVKAARDASPPGQVHIPGSLVFLNNGGPLNVALQCALWLWWCCRPNRNVRTLLWALASWCGWLLLVELVWTHAPVLCLVTRGSSQVELAHVFNGSLLGTNWNFYLDFAPLIRYDNIFIIWSTAFLPQVTVTALTCGLYGVAVWASRKRVGKFPKYA